MKTTTKEKTWGGHRPRAGRPFKVDKELWGQVTCILRRDTIEMLREGAASNRFGEFLQEHLDRYPPPTRGEYLMLQKGKEAVEVVVGGVHHIRNIGPDRPPEMYKRIREIKRRRRLEADPVIKALKEIERQELEKQKQRDRARKTNSRKSVARTRR
jgi:hypothetical protein